MRIQQVTAGNRGLAVHLCFRCSVARQKRIRKFLVVPVEFHLHPGAPHEFDSIAFTSDVARRAIADRVRVLKSI